MMRILIVEDERPTAEDIKLLVSQILKNEITSLHIETTLNSAMYYLRENPIDLLLLDLNLNSKDGFQLFQTGCQPVISHNCYLCQHQQSYRSVCSMMFFSENPLPNHTTLKDWERLWNRLKSSHAIDGHSIKYLCKNRKWGQSFSRWRNQYFTSCEYLFRVILEQRACCDLW